MEERTLDTLAGRVDGVARALLRLTAALEMAQVIDGPRLSQAWRESVLEQADPAMAASRQVLLEMADLLDEARAVRRSKGHL